MTSEQKALTAIATLELMGYTHNGAQYWKPPLGKVPNFDLVDQWRTKACHLQAENEALRAQLDALEQDKLAGFRIATQLTLETQTVEEMSADLVRQVKDARAQVEALSKPQEPVMIYHGGCTIDCGEHGHHNMEMLKLIPAGTKLYAHPAQSPRRPAMPIYWVCTGEVHEGQETYTRHDAPVPMADYEVTYSAPAPTRPAASGIDQIMLIAGNYAEAWSAAQDPTSEDVFEWLDAERKALEEAIRQFAAAPQAEVQTPGDWVRNNVSGRGELVEALARQADAQGIDRCTSCDGTGDLIDMTGEWLGYCVCEEGRALTSERRERLGAACAKVFGWQKQPNGAPQADEHANCPSPVDAIEAAEREHMGCVHCKTGIYARPRKAVRNE